MLDAKAVGIDPERLKWLLDGINAFGRDEATGGFDRIGFSDADLAARRWFAAYMENEGLRVSWDSAGNVFGQLGETDAPSVMAGSHIDTVPQGGAFDGALGVAIALECALAIRDAGLPLAHPVEVVVTSEEEGRFGGMLGSQAIVGAVTREWLENATDANGERLWEAMAAQGFDPARIPDDARPTGSVKAFLELHVEQGPVLERTGISVGIADCVSGVSSWAVTLTGTANHSGTTPMDMRADAFAGLTEIGAAIPDLITKHGSEQSRVTIGKVELAPNFPHTIPGRADFSVIIRDTDETVMKRLTSGFEQLVGEAARQQGLEHNMERRSWLSPVRLDDGLVRLQREEAGRLGLRSLVMPSGAGHDAQTMQALCPAGLIFVPSRAGVSHSPDEWSDWDAILDGARVMLQTIVRLATAL